MIKHHSVSADSKRSAVVVLPDLSIYTTAIPWQLIAREFVPLPDELQSSSSSSSSGGVGSAAGGAVAAGTMSPRLMCLASSLTGSDSSSAVRPQSIPIEFLAVNHLD